AGDGGEIRAVLARALLIAGGLAALLLLFQGPLKSLGFHLVAASPAVSGPAEDYIAIRIWSAPATLSIYCLHGWLLGMQDARGVLILTLALQGLNALLSVWFVLGFGWGVSGIAGGTLLAEYLAVGVGLLLLRRHLRAEPGRLERRSVFDLAKFKALIGVSSNLMIRTLAVLTGMGLFTRVSAQLGDLTLSANQLLQQLTILLAYALDGFADAAEALVGHAQGARQRQRAQRMVLACLQLAGLAALAFTLAYALVGMEIIALFTKHPEVVAEAAPYIIWLIAMPLVSVWCYVLDGVFLGALRTAAIRNAMLASLAFFWMAQALLVPLWGNHGLWLALLLFFAARGITLGIALPNLLRAIKPAG
ncbi:MAG: MATE family efflux transporter, partial [Pseudomonadota bacterium]